MSDQAFNKLRNLAQIFCDKAGVQPSTPDYMRVTISSTYGVGSFFDSMKFLKELSRQNLIVGFEEVSDGLALRSREAEVAQGVFVRGANDGKAIEISFPVSVAECIEENASFDFDPNS